MNRSRYPMIVIFPLLTLLIFLSGCSDGNEFTMSSGTSEPTVAQYFPLQPGRAVDYVINNQENQTEIRERFTIGGSVSLNSAQGYRWISYDVKYPSYVDTGYLQILNNALYYYDTPSSLPEKLLQAPLEVGKSWLRFDPTELTLDDSDNYIDIIGDGDDPKGQDSSVVPGGTDVSGFGAGKNFPTFGSNYFVIAAVEDIQLEDGNIYRNCLRVENRAGDMTNCYWYAPDLGLIKYAINAASVTYPGGQIIGEVAAPRNN